MIGLTQTQANLLNFVKERIASNGIAPSYDELAAHLNLKSRGNINRIINALVERGALHRLPGKARALSIPPAEHGLRVDPLPEIRRAISTYARANKISERAAVEEALRSYFMEPASQ